MVKDGRRAFTVELWPEDLAIGSQEGGAPESWACADCGFDTAPGHVTRGQIAQMLAAGRVNQRVTVTYDDRTEVYHVRDKVWSRAGMGYNDGCLCIGCLEKRIGRRLRPKDFPRSNALNMVPGTARLLARRG